MNHSFSKPGGVPSSDTDHNGPRVSVVIPLHNEAETLRELYGSVRRTMERTGSSWELVLVNDGSADDTPRILDRLHAEDPRVVVVHLRRNYGQTPALMAGFDHAQGELVVAMDGDLQHDPAEIPKFLEKIQEGYDLVSGWRVSRSDAFLTRTLPSRIANWLMAKASGVPLHDFGTTYKAYRREILEDLHLYGELHRFVPALTTLNGARIAEIPIRDMGRNRGKSHYGLSRTFRVLFDLMTVRFILRYMTRPLHFFGKLFLGCMGLSGAIGLFLAYRKLIGGIHIFQEHGPLSLLAAALMLAAVQFLAIGLIGEVLVRIYYESQDKKIYAVKRLQRRTWNEGDLEGSMGGQDGIHWGGA
ncbi:MAG: glycosyltransferase family 2 protein [Deltaproteobacteria bacterium]|nr:glycosyltransferase family 2 protein [Deltaproteobacteria bacterium]